MVEKPAKGTAPSNLHITGRYILQPEIFGFWQSRSAARAARSSSPTRMITLMDAKKQPFHAVRFDGTIYDCGSKIGFLTANIAYALEREGLGDKLRAALKTML